MKLFLSLLFLSLSVNLIAQEIDETKEQAEIEQTIKILVDAWKAGDAQKFASPFASDADFIVWFGLKLHGKEEIAFGHNLIFKDFYANTVWDLRIDKIRFLGPEVALVHASGAILKNGESNPPEPDAVPLIVFHKI